MKKDEIEFATAGGVPGEIPSDVLGHDVDLEVDRLANLCEPERGAPQRLRDEGDGHAAPDAFGPSAVDDVDDGERDAVDGD